MDTTQLCLVLLAGFCSGVIKTGVGIGSGIFLLPVLALGFPAKTALGLAAPLMLASDSLGMRYYWKEWLPGRHLAVMLPAILAGLLLGTLLLPVLPGALFRIGVGLFGMLYALCALFSLRLPRLPCLSRVPALPENARLALCGACGGAATVLAHAGGLVWSLVLLRRIPDRRLFVGTLVLLFFLTNIYKTVAYVLVDTVSVSQMLDVLPAVPAVWAGSALGNLANRRLDRKLFRTLVLAVIFLVSAKLCF